MAVWQKMTGLLMLDDRYIRKDGEGRRTGALIQEEIHFCSYCMPLTGYICALLPTFSVCRVILVISKYKYTGLVKPLKSYDPSANWSGVPTHSIKYLQSPDKWQRNKRFYSIPAVQLTPGKKGSACSRRHFRK